jgi:CRP-like cAMP-binding protein
MLKSAIEKTVEAGEKLVAKGERGTGFYLIIEGRADVVSDGEKLATFKGGDFFGELAVIDGAPRTADVIAVEDTTCIVVSQWAMRSLISSHSEIALSILEELVERLRKTDAAHSSDS